MPYCHYYLKIHNPEYLDSSVQLLAKEQFSSRNVYPLDNPNHYNIDNSMNDVRAITDTDNLSIRLFCRYAKDVERFNQRLIKFVDSHPDICGVFEEGETGEESITFNLTWK
tara:strand:- start:159 stop:491 length:333 start_codon:yes stop_codon:yes gene_type:complete